MPVPAPKRRNDDICSSRQQLVIHLGWDERNVCWKQETPVSPSSRQSRFHRRKHSTLIGFVLSAFDFGETIHQYSEPLELKTANNNNPFADIRHSLGAPLDHGFVTEHERGLEGTGSEG